MLPDRSARQRLSRSAGFGHDMSSHFRPIVLCYHAVSDGWAHALSVSPGALTRHLHLMLARRFRAATAADVVAARGRLFHVTFDDAFRSVRTVLPVLERLGVPATVFACTAYADRGRTFAVPELVHEARAHPDELATMDWSDLAALAERGIEVGSHTHTHPHLTTVSDRELRLELRESREHVEGQLRMRCRFLSYPYGDHDERVRAAARVAGYDAAFALPGPVGSTDRFLVPRVGIWRGTNLLAALVKTSPFRHAIGNVRGWR
jgi:peptidoglycan/xylan/chitin deacetylase (PgdA/CDA1 family)